MRIGALRRCIASTTNLLSIRFPVVRFCRFYSQSTPIATTAARAAGENKKMSEGDSVDSLVIHQKVVPLTWDQSIENSNKSTVIQSGDYCYIFPFLWIIAWFHTYLPNFIHTHLFTHLPRYLIACLFACLHAYLPTFLLNYSLAYGTVQYHSRTGWRKCDLKSASMCSRYTCRGWIFLEGVE